MLSEDDIKTWLDGFEPEVKETLLAAVKLEDWVLDNDSEVQERCNLISKALTKVSSDPISGEPITEYDYSKLKAVSLVKLSVLQGQLSLIRGIKLFGDLCFADKDLGMNMLSLGEQADLAEKAKISTYVLNQRIYLLISLQLIDRIFNNERLNVVKEILRSQFHKGETNEEV